MREEDGREEDGREGGRESGGTNQQVNKDRWTGNADKQYTKGKDRGNLRETNI